MSFHNIFNKTEKNKGPKSQSWMLRMVTSYSIFLLMILILFVLIYHISMKQTRDSFLSQQENALIGDSKLFEQNFNIMEVYCRQLLQSKDFRTLYSKDTIDDSFILLASEIHTNLSVDVMSEKLLPVNEVFFYLPQTEYIVSSNYFLTAERYYKWMKKYKSDTYVNWLKALSEQENYYQFLPMDEYLPNRTHRFVMYTINLDDLYFMEANAVCCFIFDEEDISNTFSSSYKQVDYPFLYVTTDQNVPLLSLDYANFCTEDLSVINFDNGYANIKLDNKTISLGKYISDDTGYVYYYSLPAFATSTHFAVRQLMYFILFIAIVFIGGLIIYYFSRRNIKPIIELGEELQVAVDTNSHLQEVVDKQRPLICNSYLRRLMSGSITSEEEASYIKQYLNIEDSLLLNSLYVCVYNSSTGEETVFESNLEPEKIDEIIANAFNEYFGDSTYYFIPADRSYAVLLKTSSMSESDFIFWVHQTIVKLHNYLLDTYGIWLFAGLGKSTNDIMNVWESYQQAIEAVSYASKNYFFFPYEFLKKDSNAFYYPSELSTKLIHFITTGNAPQTMELFSLIHQENIEERSLPINILKFLLSDIRNTLLKAKFALPDTTPSEAIEKLDEQFNQHMTFKLCEDIALNLCKLFSVESEDSNLISTIEEYIKQNFSDPSLGLNKISDEFRISESYFSHLFKEKIGINFSSYLENLRMTEAARLIKETNISLNELYISVGYNNATSFRRAFKKIYGVTPSSMRPNSKDDK